MVSATTYTLVGVANKFLTVILNIVLWDKHSSQLGLLAVVCCLLAGSFYEQSPKKDDSKSKASQLDLVGKASLSNAENGHAVRRLSGTDSPSTPNGFPRKV
jgi:hypothetical protein